MSTIRTHSLHCECVLFYLLDEHIDTSKDMFAEYMRSSSSADLAAYMAQVHQIISELYHTVESVEEREIIRNALAKMAQIC